MGLLPEPRSVFREAGISSDPGQERRLHELHRTARCGLALRRANDVSPSPKTIQLIAAGDIRPNGNLPRRSGASNPSMELGCTSR